MYLRRGMFGVTCSSLGACTVLLAAPEPHEGAANDAITREIAVDSPRPLAAALQLLQERHGVVITYEDAPYLHESDLADVTMEVRRDLDKFEPGKAPKVLIPRPAQLRATYAVSRDTNCLDDPAAVIRALLQAHVDQGNPGVFRLEQTGEVFHVIPTEVKGEDGRLAKVAPVLDARISVTDKERTCADTLETICSEVRQATGAHVVVGMTPMKPLIANRVRIGARNEAARGLLARALDGLERKLSWQLFYDPGLKWYVLNIHVVSNQQ